MEREDIGRAILTVAVLSVVAPMDQGDLLRAEELGSETSHECTWSDDIGALACAVAALRAELAKEGSAGDAPNEAAPEHQNELDNEGVQRALTHLRLGDATLHAGKGRRLVRTDSFLVHAYERYQRLRDLTPKEHARDRARVEDIGNNLRGLLRSRGLNGAVSGMFSVAMVVADASNDGHSRLDSTGGQLRIRPAASILWRTRAPRRWFGVPSFGGGLGYKAVPAVWSVPRTDTSDSEQSVSDCAVATKMGVDGSDGKCHFVQHQDGFSYDVFLNWPNFRARGARLSGFIGVGQERLNSPELKIGVGDDAKVASLSDNRTGLWSYHWEYGFEYRLFDADRVDVDYGRSSSRSRTGTCGWIARPRALQAEQRPEVSQLAGRWYGESRESRQPA